MTRELDHLLDEVRMSMEYDVYSRLHNEIIDMETDFEETLILKEKIKELQSKIEAQEIIIKDMAQPKTCEGCMYNKSNLWSICKSCTRSIDLLDKFMPKAQRE